MIYIGLVVTSMCKVFLVDNKYTGHHKVYLDTLNTIDKTINSTIEMEFERRKTTLKFFIDRQKFISELLLSLNSKQNKIDKKIVHLLYIDELYSNPFLPNLNKYFKVIGTLHHYPHNKVKMKLFKIFAKKIDTIVVHSEYIKKRLVENNINNVEVIHYPSFYDYSNLPDANSLKKSMGFQDDKIIISALGGTRYDKGLDILLESFKYIPDKYKEQVILNIVGKEETFKSAYINECIKKYAIISRVDLGFVSDEEFMSNVLISDYIILPYRNNFTGNSGPMTEAIINRIPIIGPNNGNLGYLSNKYNLGITFKPEDPVSIAESITQTIDNKVEINSEYSDKLTISYFVEKYEELYKKLID